jgi:hypothetical protein
MHVALGLSEPLLNRVAGAFQQSGAFCIDLGDGDVAQLQTNLLGLAVPGLKSLTFHDTNAQLAIQVRPLKPPRITVGGGTSTLVAVWPDLALDLYGWFDGRFERAFRYQADVTMPLDLTTTGSRITPHIGALHVENARVLDASRLSASPPQVAASMTAVITTLLGSTLGNALPAFDANALASGSGLGFDHVEVFPSQEEGVAYVTMAATFGGDAPNAMPAITPTPASAGTPSSSSSLLRPPSSGGRAPWLLFGALGCIAVAGRSRGKPRLRGLAWLLLLGHCGSSDSSPAPAADIDGAIGLYASSTTLPNGDWLVTAYRQDGGDLVAGTYDAGAGRFHWELVDGKDADVGVYTSVISSPSGNPEVAYHDLDHRALKYARRDGGAWTSHVVAEAPDATPQAAAGLHAKIAEYMGRPAIGFQRAGAFGTRLSVALAQVDAPSRAEDWAIEDIRSSAAASAHVASTFTDPTRDRGTIGTPFALLGSGAYLAVAAYDPERGDLCLFRKMDGRWDPDCPVHDGPSTARRGSLANAVLEGDHVHVVYRASFDGPLVYMVRTPAGWSAPEILDDGTDATFGGERHVVGDDATLRIEAGAVRVLYQDATEGRLRAATRSIAGAWSRRSLGGGDRFEGAFPLFDGDRAASFGYARATPDAAGSLAFVPLLAP